MTNNAESQNEREKKTEKNRKREDKVLYIFIVKRDIEEHLNIIIVKIMYFSIILEMHRK